MDESAVPPPWPDPAVGEVDRLEALEQQVRQLASRLAGWVEAQLVQALDDRRNDMKALRSELQVVVNEQLAGMRAESTSMLTVATRRLEVVQEQLSERLDTVAERAAEAATTAIALRGSTSADAERLQILEEQVSQRLAQVHQQMEAQLAASAERERADVDALRAELQAVVAQAPRLAEGLERRVRAAMSRLSESVEAKLGEVAGTRQTELDELRTEFTTAIDERVSPVASASATLRERVTDVAGDVAAAAERAAALSADSETATARLDAFEQRVKAAMTRLTESVEGRVGELSTSRQVELDALRADFRQALDQQSSELRTEMMAVTDALRDRSLLTHERLNSLDELVGAFEERVSHVASTSTALGERVAEVARGVTAAAERVAALSAESEASTTRLDAFEQRVKTALGRLTDSLQSRVAEELERRRPELDELRTELQEDLAKQLSETRSDIGTAVADAHRRFLLSVERLDDRMHAVEEQAGSAAGRVELLNETVGSDGRRIEALELHTRRTDARLTDLVEVKLSELAGERIAELDEFRGQLRSALDTHLAETRAEVASALVKGRQELGAGASRLDERQAALDRQSAEAVATLDALGSSVQAALADAEERLAQAVQAKLGELDGIVAQVAEARTETAATAATLASLTRKSTRTHDQVNKKLAGLAERVDALAAAAAKAPSTEAGMLAPLRSDMRHLQAQMAELAEAVAELRSRRKGSAAPAGKAPTPAVPTRKAPAPSAGRATKTLRARRTAQ